MIWSITSGRESMERIWLRKSSDCMAVMSIFGSFGFMPNPSNILRPR